MLVKAELKHIRMSPRKIRQVIDLLRYKDVVSAQSILTHIDKRSKESLSKILRSAVANAKIKGFNPEQLYISKMVCNVGPAWKRFKAAGFGRAAPIKRRTSHVKLELDLKPT